MALGGVKSKVCFVMSRTTLCGKHVLDLHVREMFAFRSRCQNVSMENKWNWQKNALDEVISESLLCYNESSAFFSCDAIVQSKC